MKKKFCAQYDSFDCGPACLSMIASFYGRDYDLRFLRSKSFLNRKGVSLQGICEAGEFIGLDHFSAKLTLNTLGAKNNEVKMPCIIHWNQNHFVVLYKISKNLFTHKNKYLIADPAYGGHFGKNGQPFRI
ncbi:cysteine peptidase family C39 domain-containing protein [Pedobacter sp. P26]|uniref:cysteine peptidase family C39 domain-containing protein n=1 Tax=Pedobacter sp. P26 TaxID=3423956 RepID=UPI003D669599